MSEETDIAVLKLQVIELERDKNDCMVRIGSLEKEARRRFEMLEARNVEMETRQRVGKGFIIGIIATMGTLGVVALDKLREALLTAWKLFT